LPDAVSELTSEFTVDFCPSQLYRVPYNSTIRIKAKDKYGN
jgi:hypothetical protein